MHLMVVENLADQNRNCLCWNTVQVMCDVRQRSTCVGCICIAGTGVRNMELCSLDNFWTGSIGTLSITEVQYTTKAIPFLF